MNVSELGSLNGVSEMKNLPLKEFMKTIKIGERKRTARNIRKTIMALF